MTQHRLEGICSVDYTMSSYSRMSLELLSVTSRKFFVHRVLTIAHVGVSMNLTRRQHMLNNLKKIQIIKMLALK
jgi:hypothetical protein